MLKSLILFFLLFFVTIHIKAQWTVAPTSIPAGSGTIRCYTFANTQVGYIGYYNSSTNYILKTTDGGLTTSVVSTVSEFQRGLYFTSVDTGYFLGTNLYKTTNGGVSWTIMKNFASCVYGSFLRYTNNSIFVAFSCSQYTYHYIWRSNNGGITWDSAVIPFLAGNLHDVYFYNATIGYATSYAGQLAKTTNGGATWSLLSQPTYSYLYTPVFFSADTGLVSGDLGGYLLRTYDGGLTWSPLLFSTTSTVSVQLVSTPNGRLYANRGDTVFISNDRGTTWLKMTTASGLYTSGIADKMMFVNDTLGYFIGSSNPLGHVVLGMLCGNFIFPPTVSASGIYYNTIGNTSLSLSWTNGNGSRRIVVIRAIGTGINNPTDGIGYTANTVFGAGSQTGTGNYVVYDGTGTTVNVTGLNNNTTYFFTIYEYNGTGTSAKYLTTLYASSGATTVPVKLTNFKVIAGINNMHLLWQTASEINNDHFDIQRSVQSDECTDNCWEVIGAVKGNGTTNALSEYEFTDENVFPEFARSGKLDGTVYYRLKQIDFDGKITYSPIVTVNVPSHSKGIVIYPLPIDGILNIDNPDGGEMRVLIKDIQGRELLNDNANGVSYTKKVDNLSAGLYYLNIIRNGDNRVIKIIKN